MHLNRCPRCGGEDGITIVFVALLLVCMMIAASFAVDLGGLYGARRQDQNAADAGALAAAQDVVSSTGSIVNDVDSYVSNTLGITPGTLDWANGCPSANQTDTDDVDIPIVGGANSCISRDLSGRLIQVHLPTRQYNTAFAKVVGLGSFDHTATAIAGLLRVGFGSVLPYALSAGAGAGDGYVCLKTGAGGHTGDAQCDGPDSGNFGYVDFAYFGSADLGTTTDCGNGNQRNRNINNTAAGVDHDLSKYGSGGKYGTTQYIDTATPCGAVEQPNSMYVLTGNTPQDFGTGIYSGAANVFTDGQPARLQRSNPRLFNGAGATTAIGGHPLDNNPLWQFITPGLKSNGNGGVDDVPKSCELSQFVGADGVLGTADDLAQLPAAVASHFPATGPSAVSVADRTRKLLQRCFQHYQGQAWNDDGSLTPPDPRVGCSGSTVCSGVVFGRNSSRTDQPDLYDIQYTPRFGYVPELTTDFPSGNGVVRIGTFRAIWLQRLLAGQCSGSSGCDHSFDPGVPYTGSTSPAAKADGITAFVFPRSMLPNNLASETAPFDVAKNRFVKLVR